MPAALLEAPEQCAVHRDERDDAADRARASNHADGSRDGLSRHMPGQKLRSRVDREVLSPVQQAPDSDPIASQHGPLQRR